MERANPGGESSRRTFLGRLLGLGGTAALLGVGVSGTAGSGLRAGAPKDEVQGHAGYRLTEHIRRYYERAGL